VDALSFEAPVPPPPPCLVDPLSDVSDPEAVEFEAAVGTSGVINTAGLTSVTARALTRFEQIVLSAGGRVELKSAYRPAAYQAHLQEVWDKWMFELRYNADGACAPLQAYVADEFVRHQLLDTQRPVTSSDHTRGLSFDAAVILPAGARFRRRRVGIDSLARMAGVRRPAIAADPVHFRIM
jgi:D-alanyl-D-alanine dipeptidase